MAKGEEKKQPVTDSDQVPVDLQAQKAVADTATIGELHEMIMHVDEQVMQLTEWLTRLETQIAAISDPVAAVLDIAEPPQIEFDKKWLKGLTFRDVKEVTPDAGENGRKVKRYTPFDRAALVSDVMGWRKDGGEIVITLGDGSRHRVPEQ